METIDLSSWAEFGNAIMELRERHLWTTVEIGGEPAFTRRNTLLFRGQAESNWALQTTLERVTDEVMSVENYLERAASCANELQSFTDRKWNLEPVSQSKDRPDAVNISVQHYAYLAYLRQHGFPSPLLDWTTSPYAAAYFAFEERREAERCAVHVFIGVTQHFEFSEFDQPRITMMGPNVTTHPRHFAQKSCYTIATRWQPGLGHYFCSHNDAASKHDRLVRITIPRSQRAHAMRELDADFNINRFTLFQNEDALVRTIGMRLFDLDEFPPCLD